jgi:hypothetical protein
MNMSQAVYYKVSFVVEGGRFPGGIINCDQEPMVGDEVTLDDHVFTITEVMELMPPSGDFGFFHATCRYVRDAD